jgi:tetratricopeptide (TPR) repeat protein
LDLSAPTAAPAPPPEAEEVDLSADWEVAAAPPVENQPPPAAPLEAPAFNFEESRVEIDFYLENKLLDEARKVVAQLEGRFPDHEQVAQLRQRVEAQLKAAAAAAPEEAVSAPAVAETAPVHLEPLPAQAAPAPAGGADSLGELASGCGASLEGLKAPEPPSPPAVSPATAPAPAAGTAASPLSGLLEEIGEPLVVVGAGEDDPETHYNLGVAFREMSLLEEAIGEFQKVLKGAGKGVYPPNFLQACSLLALCFMDKKMPAVAAKWYVRALETPNLDEEAVLALQYDLGVAYEEAGDTRTALEKFTEVYSQNIDFRDVAEKIRVLRQKVS